LEASQPLEADTPPLGVPRLLGPVVPTLKLAQLLGAGTPPLRAPRSLGGRTTAVGSAESGHTAAGSTTVTVGRLTTHNGLLGAGTPPGTQ